MKSVTQLPEGYREILQVDLQKNKKLALLVNGLSLLIAVPAVLLGLWLVPIQTVFLGPTPYLIKCLVFLVGVIAYMILHELVHGVCMKYFCKAEVHYGYTGLYAYVGSPAYFDKRSYIIIALAPVVLWGIVLLVLSCVVDSAWFWCVYLIQICNLSGAAGDIYVTYKFSKLPKDILVQDAGVSMKVYCK